MKMIDLRGVWMPIEVINDQNLIIQEKMIYSLILFLSRNDSECSFPNSAISEVFNISVKYASRLILSLQEKKYINIKMQYFENSQKIETRVIEPLRYVYHGRVGISQLEDTSIPQNIDSSIPQKVDTINNKKIYNKIKKYENEIPYSKEELELLYDNWYSRIYMIYFNYFNVYKISNIANKLEKNK